jgi:hypothetical protein
MRFWDVGRENERKSRLKGWEMWKLELSGRVDKPLNGFLETRKELLKFEWVTEIDRADDHCGESNISGRNASIRVSLKSYVYFILPFI